MKTKAETWIWVAVAACLTLLCDPCSAQSICPWLNTATASGVLGGTPTLQVDNPSGGARTCLFRLQNETHADVLRIAVISAEPMEKTQREMKVYETSCTSSEAPLKAIGNEAILCISNTKTSRGQLIVGRVRNNVFTVTVSTSTGNISKVTQDTLAQRAEEVARQVAGSLF